MIHNLLLETCDLIDHKRQRKITISTKSSHSDLVTNVDQEIEAFLIEKLTQLYPQTKILGEESNFEIDLEHGQTWIIDPIDGTSNFVKQGQQFGILLCQYIDGIAIEAYICDGIKRDIYAVRLGQGVTKNKVKLNPEYNSTFENSLISMSPNFFLKYVKQKEKLIRECLGIRYAGSCAIDGIGVIEGYLGAFSIRIAGPWDIAPHLLFAQELGLVCLNLDGSTHTIDQKSPFIFGQKEIVERIIAYC